MPAQHPGQGHPKHDLQPEDRQAAGEHAHRQAPGLIPGGSLLLAQPVQSLLQPSGQVAGTPDGEPIGAAGTSHGSGGGSGARLGPLARRLIVEAETIAEAEAAIHSGADGVLLDEFSPEQLLVLVPRLRTLAAERGAPVVLEASGVQPAQLAAYAGTGIDLISSSAPITRSPWLDLSMRFFLDWT